MCIRDSDYLSFIADIYGIPATSRRSLIERYATAYGIDGDLGSSVGSYSHGMKQKLALVSALIRTPRLLMLDEPFVGLDPVAAHRLKGDLRSLCDAEGAVLFSTHILEAVSYTHLDMPGTVRRRCRPMLPRTP